MTQASSEITWGEEILDRLEAGDVPDDAIAPFAFDETQLAAVSFGGQLAAHTGLACDPECGQAAAFGVSAQVNTAALAAAPERMLEAFAETGGPLAERLLAALAASGGDARGQQGAGVIVAGRDPLGGYADEPHVDLRVDDHRDPIGELQRLLGLHRAHCTMRLMRDNRPEEQIEVLSQLISQHPDDPHLQRALHRARQS